MSTTPRPRIDANNPVDMRAKELKAAVQAAGGQAVFADTAAACAMIDGLPDNMFLPGDKERYRLALKSSGLGRLLAGADENLAVAQIDTAMHDVVASSGLSYSAALRVIRELFAACGVRGALMDRVVMPDIDGKPVYERRFPLTAKRLDVLTTSCMSEMNNLKDMEEGKADMEMYAPRCVMLHDKLRELTAAGEPMGFYLTGLCYLHGACGTAQDVDKAMECLSAAAEDGIPDAAALLGDIHYRGFGGNGRPGKRDYTAAYGYYTRPGALSMRGDRLAAVKDIVAQRAVNVRLLGIAAVLVVLEALFVALAVAVSPKVLAAGVVFVVLSVLCIAAAVAFHLRKPYNSVRPVILCVAVCWLVFFLIFLFMGV